MRHAVPSFSFRTRLQKAGGAPVDLPSRTASAGDEPPHAAAAHHAAATAQRGAGPRPLRSAGGPTTDHPSPSIAEETTLGRCLPSVTVAGRDVARVQVPVSIDDAHPGCVLVHRTGIDDPVDTAARSMAVGVAGIVTEQLLPCSVPQYLVADADAAAATLTHLALGRPDTRLLTIGVVGEAGKTTTALLIAKLLRKVGLQVAYRTDLGSSDGVSQTTPNLIAGGGQSLYIDLNAAVEAASQVAVIEVDSRAARNGEFDDMTFDIVVVTEGPRDGDCFGPGPIETILERLEADGVVVASTSANDLWKTIRSRDLAGVSYGRDGADVQYDILEASGGLMTMTLNQLDTVAVLESGLTGRVNAANIAAAGAVGLLMSIPINEIADELGHPTRLPGRETRVALPGVAATIVDVASTPASVSATLINHRRQNPGGRLWVVATTDCRDATHKAVGNALARSADEIVLTCGSDSKKATFLADAHCVIDGVDDARRCRPIANFEEAVRWTMSQAKFTDTVVVLVGQSEKVTPQIHRRRIERALAMVRGNAEGLTRKPRPKVMHLDREDADATQPQRGGGSATSSDAFPSLKLFRPAE